MTACHRKYGNISIQEFQKRGTIPKICQAHLHFVRSSYLFVNLKSVEADANYHQQVLYSKIKAKFRGFRVQIVVAFAILLLKSNNE